MKILAGCKFLPMDNDAESLEPLRKLLRREITTEFSAQLTTENIHASTIDCRAHIFSLKSANGT